MNVVTGDVWKRRGLSLLWSPEAFGQVARPAVAVSVRGFFALAKSWPAELPCDGGDALVVVGFEGCLDCLTPDDAETWIENDLRPVLISFQNEYQGQAALIFWLPTGGRRIRMNRANEAYLWRCGAPYSGREIEIGRILWGGAEDDAGRILDSHVTNRDPDGLAWIGLHHLRLS
jgi:hypothetical protein